MTVHEHRNETSPSQFLVDNLGLLPRGLALDVAMGSGRNSIYLAKQGFDVVGVDSSENAVQTARQFAQREGVTFTVLVADLETDYIITENYYELIICFNYLQRSLIPQIKKSLKIGGMIVYETYLVDQIQFGGPHNPDFLLRHNELLDLFRDFRCLRYREGIIENRKAIASLVAEKVK
jgi:tellurite methyltransferase